VNELRTFITGKARPKVRPKARRRGNHVQVYTPSSKHEEAVADHFRSAGWGGRLAGCRTVKVGCTFYHPHKLADVDNLAKLILDALVKAAVFDDDRDVVYLLARVDRNPRSEPGTLVIVWPG
jgi:Holliday junction resolvase RusA-like endonuclease